MKLFSVDKTFFKLPDDFDGNYATALRLLADYVESCLTCPNVDTQSDYFESPWQTFEEVLEQGGLVSGIFGLKIFDGNEWKDL